jgi:hypothetical protein
MSAIYIAFDLNSFDKWGVFVVKLFVNDVCISLLLNSFSIVLAVLVPAVVNSEIKAGCGWVRKESVFKMCPTLPFVTEHEIKHFVVGCSCGTHG